MSKRFDFDQGEYGADRVEMPVLYKGKSYTLVEATEEIIAKYRRKTKEGSFKMKKGTDTVTVDQEYAGCYLLSMCLFETGEGKRKAVHEEILRQWPRRVTGPLIEEVLDIATSFQPLTADELEARISADQERLDEMRRKAASSTNGKADEILEEPAKN